MSDINSSNELVKEAIRKIVQEEVGDIRRRWVIFGGSSGRN